MKDMEIKTENRYEYRKTQEKRKQMIAPDLFEFAYVPDWYGHLAELERLALPESWRFRKPSRETKNTETPILERYIHTIFRKQVIDFNSESDPRKADSIFHLENECVCFHTGLYTPQYKGIYGYFERNNFSDSLRDWYFRGFCDELSPKLRYIEPLPQKPVYHMAQSGINFNPEWPIRVNVNHILGDEENLERIPAKIRKVKNLPLLFETAVELGRRKSVIEPGLVVPQGYQGRVQYLLPVYLTNMQKPDLAMTLTVMDALLAVVSSERLYHPVKEYFSTLSWDGCSRIDSLLIDYMGAENTPYVRAVTRKTLVAAVARIYEPGIKFDSVLVLNGPQGCGKSTFFAKLGKEWYSDSLTISDMKDGKTAAEKLQGYWLLELGELAGIKKVDVETVKSFVTRTDDKYRQSYGTTVESHPRECVIVGSTNSEGGFLRDVTGNRRFWPVHVTGKGKHRGWDLTPETVDQIWAEAISIYKDGEELYLKGKEAAEAYVAQQEAMESDEREGIVEDYLERLLPADWDTMDLYQRRSYLGGGEFEAEGRTGTVVRERFCLMEVWCECFGKERQNFRKTDSYELESIIQKIGGWKKYEGNSSGKMRIPGYGVQRVFVRVKKETAGNK